MRLLRPLHIAGAMSVLLAFTVACSDSPAETGQPNTVTVADNFFNPVTLSSTAGATVTWTWTGVEPHNVTWVTAGLQNSATQTTGSHQVTMPAQPGTYEYFCTLHGTPTAGMRGSVVVP